MKPQAFFSRKPVFTHDEFVSTVGAKGRSPRSPGALLAYYVKTGRLLHVRRGLYAAVPPGTDPARCPVDPYLLAAKLADDAVLAYHTALAFHGKAHSALERFSCLTARRVRPLVFRGCRFRAIPFPKALRQARRESFGVRASERAGVGIRVTGFERTLVDLLDRPDLGGGWEEIWRSLESVEFFDLDQVIEYALLLDNATTAAKVGFYLEQHRETLMAEEGHLARLRRRRPRQPHGMDRGGRGQGRLVRAWNLIVPAGILQRSWEETR